MLHTNTIQTSLSAMEVSNLGHGILGFPSTPSRSMNQLIIRFQLFHIMVQWAAGQLSTTNFQFLFFFMLKQNLRMLKNQSLITNSSHRKMQSRTPCTSQNIKNQMSRGCHNVFRIPSSRKNPTKDRGFEIVIHFLVQTTQSPRPGQRDDQQAIFYQCFTFTLQEV